MMTKKDTIKKMYKDIFNNLRYNRCLIRLDEVEEKFLKNRILSENNLSLKNTVNALLILNERADVQYFSDNHVVNIAEDLLFRINEEVGRNIHTASYSSEPEKVKRSINICTVTGKYIVSHSSKDIYFDDEDSAILYARNNKIY